MYCAKCGAKVGDGVIRYCTICGEPVPARPPALDSGAVWKGEFVATLRPPFLPFGKYGRAGWAGTVALVAFFTASLILHWTELTPGLLVVLFFGTIFLLNRVVFLLQTVRVYEHGLEQDIPRSWNKSAFLPWLHLTEHHWDGDILRYSWLANGMLVLKDGQSSGTWPFIWFPRALRVPAERIGQIRDLITRS